MKQSQSAKLLLHIVRQEEPFTEPKSNNFIAEAHVNPSQTPQTPFLSTRYQYQWLTILLFLEP